MLADHKANSFPELHVLVFGRSCVILFCYYLMNTYFDFACAAQGPETILPVSTLPFEWFSLILQYAHFCGRGFNWRHQSEVQNLHRQLQALVAMSQGITLLPEKSLLLFFNYERPYYQEYAVGFSGVLFAMKIILNAQSHDYTYVHGLLVPTRYAAWAELILIQMFVPGVSFLGHLGAILAGLLFLCLKASYSGANPLRTIIRGFGHALNWPLMFMNCLFRRQIIGGRGTVGGRRTRDTSQMWRCQGCTFDNSGWLNVCEMCSTSRTDDVLSSLSSTDEVQDLSLDELRHRRIQRYGR